MISRGSFVVCSVLLCAFTARAHAQTSPAAQTPAPAASATAAAPQAVPADSAQWAQWQAFLPGTWGCIGAFSNGKKLEADMTFASVLDNRWITYTHADRAPGRFKTIALWGIQSGTHRLLSMMQDNAGGARRFEGTMSPDQVTFQIDRTFSNATRDERFRWQREGANLRMTWEISPVAGTWVTGDYVLCTKTP